MKSRNGAQRGTNGSRKKAAKEQEGSRAQCYWPVSYGPSKVWHRKYVCNVTNASRQSKCIGDDIWNLKIYSSQEKQQRFMKERPIMQVRGPVRFHPNMIPGWSRKVAEKEQNGAEEKHKWGCDRGFIVDGNKRIISNDISEYTLSEIYVFDIG